MIVTKIDEAFAFVKEEFAKLEKKLSDVAGAPPANTKLESYDEALKELNNIYRFREYGNETLYKVFKHDDIDKKEAELIQRCEFVRGQIEEIGKRNAVILGNNALVRAKITEMMKYYGIPDSTYETDPKSRARYPKSYKKDAGWVVDMRKHVPLIDGKRDALMTIESWIGSIKKVATELRKVEESKKQAEAAIEKERQQKILLVEMLKKYDLPGDKEMDDVLEHILGLNKYLRLAHYLLLNRGSWMDGCSYAETGLEGFKVESDLDKEIYEDIDQHCGDGWDGDGRCFRDTRWSYDALYGLVEKDAPDLLNDYTNVRVYVKEY